MNPEEMTAALNAMLEQGNQLRASKLVPVLKAVIEALPSERAKRQYLTFEAVGDATTVKFYAYDDGSGALHAKTIEVSTDGATWTEKTSTADGTTLATLNARQKLYVRGNNEAYGWYSGEDYADDVVGNFFAADKNVYLYGNMMSLIIGDDALSGRQVALAPYAFASLFHDYNNGALSGEFILSHQTKSLVLPATTLADYCYSNMFYGCTGLTAAPALPATTLADYCYSNMFYGCTGLTAAPTLPATTLADYCYNSMFQGCTGLTAAPALPATTLANDCYSSMFYGCTGLTAAPTLPATTLADNCYSYMFSYCSNLAAITCLATTTAASSTWNWLKNVAASGTFTKSADAAQDFWATGANGIPSGWTVQTASN